MQLSALQRYVDDVLGLQIDLAKWQGESRLPMYLRDRYEIFSTELLGNHCLLAIAGEPQRSDVIRRDFEVLRSKAPESLPIFVTQALTSFERRRLIQKGVPFIVPGNQLFVPELGIDLREHFRDRRERPTRKFSPASQSLLIVALLQPWQERVHPTALAAQLRYSTMTISRVASEWTKSGLAEAVVIGKERWLSFSQGPRETWQKAQDWLRTPVRSVHWAVGHSAETADAPLAGLSALAELTLLAEPPVRARALTSGQWKRALDSSLQAVPGPEEDVTRYEIWRYGPQLIPGQPAVDPLSLMISLQDDRDERVAQALETLENQLPW